MTPATNEQIEEACMTRSGSEAARHLASRGLLAGQTRCNVAIALLIERGARGKFSTMNVSGTIAPDMTIVNAKEGCRKLLERMLMTGHHWLHCEDKMAAALRQAELVA